MNTDPDTNNAGNSPQHQRPEINDGAAADDDHASRLTSDDVPVTQSVETPDLQGDDALLGALAHPSFSDSNIDHTLDQLTTSSDLFDVPALDFYDDMPT
jgi:hypothetical protein